MTILFLGRPNNLTKIFIHENEDRVSSVLKVVVIIIITAINSIKSANAESMVYILYFFFLFSFLWNDFLFSVRGI